MSQQALSSRWSTFLFVGILLAHLPAFTACTNTVTLEKERAASNATWQWLENRYGFVQTPELTACLQKLVERLASATQIPEVQKRAPSGNTSYGWQLFVLNSQDTNAFSIGSGVIVVTRGLVQNLQSEAGLASVVSHEMAHYLLGHTRNALTKAGDSSSASPTAAPDVSFSLQDEIAADTLGVRILQLARYDIREALEALTLSYRPADRPVSANDSEWREKRIINLSAQVRNLGHSNHATRSTREFRQAQRTL